MVLKLVDLDSQESVSSFLAKGGKLLFLYGPKCPPCQRLKPKLFEALEALDETMELGFADAQAHPELRELYNAKYIPFLIVFEGEEMKDTLQNSDMNIVAPFLNRHFNFGLSTTSFDADVDF